MGLKISDLRNIIFNCKIVPVYSASPILLQNFLKKTISVVYINQNKLLHLNCEFQNFRPILQNIDTTVILGTQINMKCSYLVPVIVNKNYLKKSVNTAAFDVH